MWLSGKQSACNAGDEGSIPGSRRASGGENDNPLQSVLLPGKPHGQKSLAGCSPWGHKESDTTERLSAQDLTQTASGLIPSKSNALLTVAGK